MRGNISTGWNPITIDAENMRDIVPIELCGYMAVGTPVITTKLPGVMKEFGEDHGVIYVDKMEVLEDAGSKA